MAELNDYLEQELQPSLDAEDWSYMTSRAFWEMIRERRQRPTVRLADVRAELLADE